MVNRVLVIFIFSCISIACSQLTCRLENEPDSSNANDSGFQSGTRLIVGPPGKQGPPGAPGDLRNCNCTDYSKIEEQLSIIEEKLSILESK